MTLCSLHFGLGPNSGLDINIHWDSSPQIILFDNLIYSTLFILRSVLLLHMIRLATILSQTFIFRGHKINSSTLCIQLFAFFVCFLAACFASPNCIIFKFMTFSLLNLFALLLRKSTYLHNTLLCVGIREQKIIALMRCIESAHYLLIPQYFSPRGGLVQFEVNPLIKCFFLCLWVTQKLRSTALGVMPRWKPNENWGAVETYLGKVGDAREESARRWRRESRRAQHSN